MDVNTHLSFLREGITRSTRDNPYVLPPDWMTTRSTAIEAYRYRPADKILQILYRKGRKVYDFPCDEEMFKAFETTGSKGRFVERVLKRHARALGWSVRSYRFR